MIAKALYFGYSFCLFFRSRRLAEAAIPCNFHFLPGGKKALKSAQEVLCCSAAAAETRITFGSANWCLNLIAQPLPDSKNPGQASLRPRKPASNCRREFVPSPGASHRITAACSEFSVTCIPLFDRAATKPMVDGTFKKTLVPRSSDRIPTLFWLLNRSAFNA